MGANNRYRHSIAAFLHARVFLWFLQTKIKRNQSKRNTKWLNAPLTSCKGGETTAYLSLSPKRRRVQKCQKGHQKQGEVLLFWKVLWAQNICKFGLFLPKKGENNPFFLLSSLGPQALRRGSVFLHLTPISDPPFPAHGPGFCEDHYTSHQQPTTLKI